VFVENLTEEVVSSPEEAYKLLVISRSSCFMWIKMSGVPLSASRLNLVFLSLSLSHLGSRKSTGLGRQEPTYEPNSDERTQQPLSFCIHALDRVQGNKGGGGKSQVCDLISLYSYSPDLVPALPVLPFPHSSQVLSVMPR
jgi:hypothetical protein